MNIHGYKLEHEDYYVPSGMFHKKIDHIDSKESEGVYMCHLYDLDDCADKIIAVSIEVIPEINLEDGSKFNLKK